MQSDPVLYVRCRTRRYELAKPDQILGAARQIVDARSSAEVLQGAGRCLRHFSDKLKPGEGGIRRCDAPIRGIGSLSTSNCSSARLTTPRSTRVVAKCALRLNAAAVIVAHKPPFGRGVAFGGRPSRDHRA